MTERYRLQASYTDVEGSTEAAWQSGTSFTSGAEVLVAPTTPATVGVSVRVPNGARSAKLTLRAVSTANEEGSSQSSAPVGIVIGEEQVESDPRIVLGLGEVGGTNLRLQDTPDGSFRLQVRYLPSGPRTVNVPITARFEEAGTYEYTAGVPNGDDLWSIPRVSPGSSTESAQGAQDITVQLRLHATSPSDELRDLIVVATRRETGGVGQIAGRTVIPIQGFAS
jgi:hypothetical protein